jgi:serine/threonine protein kinase
MTNRRLRERLTKADILQIFVDVCEGVAAMHSLHSTLLHCDLEVKNVLQSSDVRYKLCDFGSTSAVAPRLPSNTQEIRALEADLNRHTTLQYRTPEMVDPYLRRPIDEKSDVCFGCPLIQTMLLHDTIRGTRSSRHPECPIQNPSIPCLFMNSPIGASKCCVRF